MECWGAWSGDAEWSQWGMERPHVAEMELPGKLTSLHITTTIKIKDSTLVILMNRLQIGLKGEELKLHSLTGSSSVEWGQASQNQPLTWYKVSYTLFRYRLRLMLAWIENISRTSSRGRDISRVKYELDVPISISLFCRLSSMHRTGMSHWLWTWVAWEKAKRG